MKGKEEERVRVIKNHLIPPQSFNCLPFAQDNGEMLTVNPTANLAPNQQTLSKINHFASLFALLDENHGDLPQDVLDYCRSVLYHSQDPQETVQSCLPADSTCLVITLNRKKNYNALSFDMILRITLLLLAARGDPQVSHILLRSSSEGVFCAGGDVKNLQAGEAYAREFFAAEFNLNRLIFRYNKPIVALLNGITMGGGVGVSVYCKYRVADANRFVFAMPENVLGLFTDIGSTFFLPIVCPSFGVASYVALTGLRLNAWDSKYCNLVTHVLQSDTAKSFSSLEQQIITIVQGTCIDSQLKQLLDRYCNVDSSGYHDCISGCNLARNRTEIDKLFSEYTIERVLENIEQSRESLFAQQAIAVLDKQCPTSLKVTLESLRRGSSIDRNLEDALRRDYRLAVRMISRHDFKEGVRVVLIEKNRVAQWSPNELKQVSLPQIQRELFDAPLDPELHFYNH